MFGIFIFLIVLSILVFFHELGHFLAAKACGVYVDRFSIGMPPRLFGIQIGETDYCLGALPVGGYVKMAGQEDAPLTEEQREKEYGRVPPERWFNNKPVWQRFIVMFGGPFMNFLLAILLYGVLAALGDTVPEMEVSARIGKVVEGSPASTAPMYLERNGRAASDFTGPPDAVGWQTGDVVVSLDGKPVEKYADIFFSAVTGGAGYEQIAVIERPNLGGTTTRYVSPVASAVFGEEEHPRFGVPPFSSAFVGRVFEGTPAARSGLQEGDIILRANGVIVDQTTFVELTEKAPEGGIMRLVVDRNSERVDVSVQPETVGRLQGVTLVPEDAGEEHPRPLVAFVVSNSSQATGIQRGDVLVEVNGLPAVLSEVDDYVKAHPGGEMRVKVARPTILFGFIQQAETLALTLPIESVRAIGVGLHEKLVTRTVPPSQWLPEAFRRSYHDLRQTLIILKALVVGDVSPKMIGGPVMILTATSRAAELGFTWLLGLMALISINLAVFNLLPLPVLDGGQIVIQGVEGIRKRPLSPKFLERFQMVGLLLIIGLMLFVTWNDIGRWIETLRP